MPSLPEPSQNLSLAIYDQKILILGSQHSKLYLFDPTIMSYSNLNLNLKGNTPKVVYANDGMINILVYEGNSFISINRSLFSYTNLGNLSFPKDFFDIDGCVVLTEKFLEINNRKFEINSANKRVVEIFDK